MRRAVRDVQSAVFMVNKPSNTPWPNIAAVHCCWTSSSDAMQWAIGAMGASV